MKRYLDLVPISAKIHRKQSRMSIFCIVLAVFLMTTIFGMADMFIRSQVIKTQTETGNWHIGVQNITDEDAAIIAARPDVDTLAPYDVLNYNSDEGYTLNGTETLICGGNETLFTKIFSNMIAAGGFPQSSDEAMITENAKDMLNLSIGDPITVDMPNGAAHTFRISGFVKNTANLMSNDSYGVFITTEKFRSLSADTGNGESLGGSTVFYVQFSDTGNVQSEILDLKSQYEVGTLRLADFHQ